MPEAVTAAAAWAAEAASGAAYAALTSVGVGAEAAAAVSTYAASITAVTVATLAQVGPALLFQPNIPPPDFARAVKRQAIPDRMSGYGRVRIGGSYMLWETDGTNEGNALNVFANHDGLLDGWEQLYLNDDKVTVVDGWVQAGPDLRYGKFSDLIQMDTRRGLPTETHYAQVTALRAEVWPATSRGDGIGSLMMIAKSKETEQFARDYPNGLPLPSGVARLQLSWDPRLGDRGVINNDSDKEASSTWGWSQNVFRNLLDYMTNPETGMGLPLSRFLPVIDRWIEAMNVCDELVALDGGGTVPRYQMGGVYLHSTDPADVIASFLACADGWMAQDANGCFVVEAGKYYEPTVTITDDHIVGISRQFFLEDERATNELVISFTDPTFDYTEVETDPWRNQDDIDARGVVRSQRLPYSWVQNNSQARRLGKIAIAKITAPIRGTLTTTLDGLRAWSERRIRIQAPSDGETMADIVVDTLPMTLNPDMTVTIPFVSCDPTAYDWTTSEEGEGPGDDTRPDPDPADVPVIDSAVPFSQVGSTMRLRVYISNALPGFAYRLRWRQHGMTTWTTEALQTAVDGTPYPYVETGVLSGEQIDLEALLWTVGGPSEWSATFVVTSGLAMTDEDGDTLESEDGDMLEME